MLGLRFSTRWESLIPLITSSNSPHIHHFVLKYVFQLSIHSLWRERNGRRHGESPTPASTLSKLIDKNMRNRLSSLALKGSTAFEGGLRYWFSTHTRN
ncbi:unnamed protein product [Arabidopsis halleri]